MKPSIPKGTRDFTPSEVNLRDFVKEKIKSNSKQVLNHSIIGSCKTDADCDDKFPCCSRFEKMFS